MGARSRELRTPWRAMSARRPSQSQRWEGSFTPHMSCCKMPRDTGQPAYVSYGPARGVARSCMHTHTHTHTERERERERDRDSERDEREREGAGRGGDNLVVRQCTFCPDKALPADTIYSLCTQNPRLVCRLGTCKYDIITAIITTRELTLVMSA